MEDQLILNRVSSPVGIEWLNISLFFKLSMEIGDLYNIQPLY